MGLASDNQRTRAVLALMLAATAFTPSSAGAKELQAPVGLFVEGGISDDSRSVVVGAAWTWVQPSKWGAGNASGYLETSVGEWACHREEGEHYRHCSVLFGITPVLRYSNGGIKHPNPGENWFQLPYMHWFK